MTKKTLSALLVELNSRDMLKDSRSLTEVEVDISFLGKSERKNNLFSVDNSVIIHNEP
jgi:hypothetical protein